MKMIRFYVFMSSNKKPSCIPVIMDQITIKTPNSLIRWKNVHFVATHKARWSCTMYCIFLESYNKYLTVTVKTKYRKNYLRSCVCFHVGFLSRNLDFPVTAPGARSKRFSGYCPRLIRQEDPNRTMGAKTGGPIRPSYILRNGFKKS
jgi:hypothetical protein